MSRSLFSFHLITAFLALLTLLLLYRTQITGSFEDAVRSRAETVARAHEEKDQVPEFIIQDHTSKENVADESVDLHQTSEQVTVQDDPPEHLQAATESPPADPLGPDHLEHPNITDAIAYNAAQAIHNDTLGFQNIFVVNMPSRSDKLDVMTAAARLSNFTFEIAPGVDGHTINNKSFPALAGIPSSHHPSKATILGCWRAHMDAAQRIVRERIQTALIVEDDADWGVGLKEQLEMFARGSRYVLGSEGETHSPYGDGWDLLWLGHCSTGIEKSNPRRFVIENDPTVPPPFRRTNFGGYPKLDKMGYSNSTRLVFQASSGICTYAYAISLRGATKMLVQQNRIFKMDPIDFVLARLCGSEPNDPKPSWWKCIGVMPQLFDSHHGAGLEGKDSDMEGKKAGKVREKGYTYNIVNSVKVNLERLGKGEEADRQWKGDEVVEGDLNGTEKVVRDGDEEYEEDEKKKNKEGNKKEDDKQKKKENKGKKEKGSEDGDKKEGKKEGHTDTKKQKVEKEGHTEVKKHEEKEEGHTEAKKQEEEKEVHNEVKKQEEKDGYTEVKKQEEKAEGRTDTKKQEEQGKKTYPNR